MRHLFEVPSVERYVSDQDVENVACGCEGPCEHVPVLSEVVLPPLRPRSVRMRALDRKGLVEMAYGRGVGPMLEMARRTRPTPPGSPKLIPGNPKAINDEMEEPAAG
jgi:hypothetical protein